MTTTMIGNVMDATPGTHLPNTTRADGMPMRVREAEHPVS
jgi:hypothetical protein